MSTSTSQVFASRAALRRGVVAGTAIVAVLALVSIGVRQHASFLLDPEELRAWIDQFGAFAPVVLVVVQATQVVVAPVPGQAVALVAGYAFGPVAGSAYSVVGVLAGSAIAFGISRRFGRPAAERLLHEDLLERFDSFVERAGVCGLLVFVLIPGLPDDAVCFLSGLTDIRLRTFLAVIAVGRLPAYVLTVYAGEGFAAGEPTLALAILGAVAVTSVVGYCKQDAVRGALGRSG